MYAIVIFGAVMVAISLVMVATPETWARAVLRFTRMPYMHPFEIGTRLGFGFLFVTYADQSRFPTFIRLFGYLLLAIGLGLLLTPPSYHRRFGVWSVEKFSKYFRFAGLASLAFGMFLIYAAIR